MTHDHSHRTGHDGPRGSFWTHGRAVGQHHGEHPYGARRLSRSVKTIIDLTSPREAWVRLGHDFRVKARVVVWKGDRVLMLPSGSLFRSGESWAVFAVRNDRARLTPVSVRQRNARQAEIVAGVAAGDRVVLHPSDRIRDGVRVAQRNGAR